jgi:hypothetical protein
MSTLSISRPIRDLFFPGWLAITSGLAGLLSFAFLLTYLFNPASHMDESGAMPHAARLLLNTDFMAAMLQAVLMLPVVSRLDCTTRQQSPVPTRIASFLGMTGFSLVALLRVLTIFKAAVSDILFMAPTALVGMWLLLVNWLLKATYSRAIQILGIIVAVLLIGVGLNFFFNGGLAVFTKGPLAYGNDVPFHIGLTLTGAPAFTLFPAWSILLGIRFLKTSRIGEQPAR